MFVYDEPPCSKLGYLSDIRLARDMEDVVLEDAWPHFIKCTPHDFVIAVAENVARHWPQGTIFRAFRTRIAMHPFHEL